MRSIFLVGGNPGGVILDRSHDRIRPFFVLVLALLLCVANAVAEGGESEDDSPADLEMAEALEVEDQLTVTSTRLLGTPEPTMSVPANVTVLSREVIERSGATTVQDLMSSQTGTVLYDQIGNGVQTTFDLRGFTTGAGTRVFVDGVPVNEARNNGLWLDVVPLGAVDRVEITRGSNAAQAGGGALGGILNLWTRQGEELGGRLSASAGDFGTNEFSGEISNGGERWDVFIGGLASETDGFRDNAGGDLRHLGGRVGLQAGANGRMTLSFTDGRSDFGAPGALTEAELGADPGQTPFNEADFVDRELGLLALNYSGALSPGFSLTANAFARDGTSSSLSTGRSAVVFGGFLAETDESVLGAILQGDHEANLGDGVNRVSFGLEYLDGETDALGLFTPATDPGNVDMGVVGSDNRAERTTTAIYLQDTWQPSDSWTVVVGARWDDDEVGYDESIPDPLNGDATNFSEVSLRAGLTWAPGPSDAVWFGYGEGFLPPSAEQLFSFPLFGSNPDLLAEDGESVELGWRHSWSRINLDLSVFRQETSNEIVFDPNSPLGLFGANVNAGETRRDGLEAAFRGRVSDEVHMFFNASLIEAEFESGPAAGNTVPLVPSERFATGVDWSLARGFDLRADVLYVSDQVLSNDAANQQERLDAYTVVNSRLSWSWATSGVGGRGRSRDGVTMFVEARNLLDEQYATRGIFAFNTPTGDNATFLTPAPGRRVMGGIEWGF